MANNVFKNFVNLVTTMSFMTGLSFFSYQFCDWYGCHGWSAFLRADLICNACTDASYHLKNYQISLYGSVFTLITFKMTTLISKAGSPTDTTFFDELTTDILKEDPKKSKLNKD